MSTTQEKINNWLDSDNSREDLCVNLASLEESLINSAKQIELLKEENEWVSVEDRLPEEEGYYLTSVEVGHMDVVYWNGVGWDYSEGLIKFWNNTEPPKKETE